MTVDEQVEVIEKQISNFDTILEKVRWITIGFDPDPAFSREATDIVRGKLSQQLKEQEMADPEEEAENAAIDALLKLRDCRTERRNALDALSELVCLKDLKDKHGKTESYLRRQPEAWKQAKDVLKEGTGGAGHMTVKQETHFLDKCWCNPRRLTTGEMQHFNSDGSNSYRVQVGE